MLIKWGMGSSDRSSPINRVRIDLVGYAESYFEMTITKGDSSAWHGIYWKPALEGTFTPQITIWNGDGFCLSALSPVPVTVVR